MKRYENECVCCPPEMGCLGESCPNRNVAYHYCDKCGDDVQLYEYEGQELCIDCIEQTLVKVN